MGDLLDLWVSILIVCATRDLDGTVGLQGIGKDSKMVDAIRQVGNGRNWWPAQPRVCIIKHE